MLRKIFMFLMLLCCSSIVVNAASYDIQVTVSTQKTNCYTDGKIFVKLSGADLGVLEASDQISFNVQKNGKSYKQHDFTIADMRADSVFVLEGYPAGTYSLDYSIWIGSHSEINGSIADFKVEANPYLELAVFQTLGTNLMMQGTRPSLNCKPTGRVQLEIVQGKFPYTVQIFKNGVLLRSDVFNSRMFSGTDPLTEDYRDYYNIEQLGIGSYTFIVTDSCGYQITLADPILVNDVNFSCVPNFVTYVTYSNNQVFFSLVNGFFNNVKYDNFSSQWLEYRFALEGNSWSAWKPFSTGEAATVASLASVQGKKYKFELRVKDCTSYPVCTADVLIPTPPPPQPPGPCKKKLSPSVSLIPIPGTGTSDFCPCNGGTPNPTLYDKWQVTMDFNLCDGYTLPITYKWTNLNYPLYSYSESINSSSLSYKSSEYTLSDIFYGNQIHIQLTDAAGRVQLDTIVPIPPKPQPPTPTPPERLIWKVGHIVTGDTACTGIPVGSVFLNVDCSNIPNGATIDMTQTPNGYHFTTSYDVASKKWNFTPNSFSDFNISQSTYNSASCGSSVNVNFDNLFRYGNYKFTVKWRNLNGTDTTTTLTEDIPINFSRYAISKKLSFTTKKTCQGTNYYPSAQVLSWAFGDDGNKKPAPTKFRVSSGNITGYEINGGKASFGLCNSDSLLITKPGRYIVQSFCSPSGGNEPDSTFAACTICTDTIDYVIQTLSFDNYYGYLCADSRGSTIRGNVTVIAKDGSGVPPYRYDLYSGDDTNGKLIGSNYTGVFNDVKVSSAKFYVRVEDQCRSSFGVAIPLSPVITTDAVFGDHSVCTGSVAYLQGKMIGTTNQVSYQWTGSNGFSSSNRQIVTPPILQPATFSLEISGLGCRIFDSITVKPVDKIIVYYEDLICQGTNYDGGKEYKQPIATANLATGLYHFSSGPFPAANGGCDSTANLTLQIIAENSVIEDTMVICDNQFPFLWQDSLFTEGTPSGVYFKSKRKNNCSYKFALRLTVNHPPGNTLLEQFICEGESVVFNGKTYSESGYYAKHFTAKTTCDSLVTLHVTVISPDRTTLTDSIFQGESYNKNGFTFPVQNDIGEKDESFRLKNRFGCDSTVYLQLTVLSPAVVIPEVFTPNGDNKNEVFKIKNIDRYPLNHILIFNRWGNKVYEGKPYMNEWDGKNYFGPKVGGNSLPVGTYFYILNLGDGSETIKGYIYLNK
ncbi:MAG: gliding motility-associated C-terminal domain-containing protein [Paludibacteraceae bacterium]|nr:gliding motility-associated C-terminal domain-containing protein [Paludibacteraceae bacterium]